jgi:hypothetical protein
MFSFTRSLAVAVLPLSLLALVACGGSGQPGAKPAESAAPPPAASAPAAAAKTYMTDHYSRTTTIQEAVIRGDLDAAREPARWIAEHQELAGLPATVQPQVDGMKNAAKAVAEAADLKSAASATARMAVACGKCHAAMSIQPTLAPVPQVSRPEPAPAHMQDHLRAMDLLYDGLIGPSDEAWIKGADALRASPLTAKELPKDQKLTREVLAQETEVHALADKARQATDAGARAVIYGEFIAACAGCHALHGSVWGPGLPK